MRTITCGYALHDLGAKPAPMQAITLDGDRITAIGPAKGPVDDLFVMPPFANAHDHGRSARPTSIGGSGKPLEAWINYLVLFPSVDPYLASVVSLARSALGGSATIMMHYTRAQGLTDFPTEVAEVARAAKDVGVRVGFGISMKDRNPLVYGPSEPILAALPEDARRDVEARFLRQPLTPRQFIELADAVYAAAGNPNFDIHYGPNGVQWCSHELLEAIAAASARTGRRIHMHLLETRYQRAWADQNYPGGIVPFLDSIGFLSPRLTLAHCVWARPDELELIAARGATIAANHSSNLHLRSGIPPVQQMVAAGCKVALGLDASALDEDDDALRELRLAHLLQVGTGFEVKVSREQILKMALAHGHLSVMNKAREPRIEAGAPADLLVLDWAKLDDEKLRPEVDPLDFIFARARSEHVKELIVGGRSVIEDGKVTGADYEGARREVLDRMRAGLKNEQLAAAMPYLERAVARHYYDAPCC